MAKGRPCKRRQRVLAAGHTLHIHNTDARFAHGTRFALGHRDALCTWAQARSARGHVCAAAVTAESDAGYRDVALATGPGKRIPQPGELQLPALTAASAGRAAPTRIGPPSGPRGPPALVPGAESRRDSEPEARGGERHGARDSRRPLPGRRGYVRGALRGAGSGSGYREHGSDKEDLPCRLLETEEVHLLTLPLTPMTSLL